jgi:ABC-type multidrug transport system ATPase subunit
MWYDMYGVPIDATEDDLSRILQEVSGLAHVAIGGFRLGEKRRRDMAQVLAHGPHEPLLT